ncbi:MAG: DNA/RNA nuclease SfsA [Thermoplasmata archaeon]
MRAWRLKEARFAERRNRFLVEVDMEDRPTLCHLPNPGRLRELLQYGARVYLRERPREGRKTRYDLVAVQFGPTMVSIDSRLPNRSILHLLRERCLREFADYTTIIPEVRIGSSRVDFLLRNGADCYLEVKSCTLVVDGVALFPDAPTERGRRHLEELATAAESGLRAAILFVVQRPDVAIFRPNDESDPEFAAALRQAHLRGVEVYAYRSRFDGVDLVDFEAIQISLRAG